MIFRYSIKNLARNKKRSFLTALSIFFAAMIAGLAQGWVNGIMDSFILGYIKYQTAHLRITTQEYIKRERFTPVDELITNPSDLCKRILSDEDVSDVYQRTKFNILLSKNGKTIAAVGMAIDPDRDPIDSKLKPSGCTASSSCISIGWKLAEKLGLKENDELLLAAKTSEGGLNGIKVRVSRIFRSGMNNMDRRVFFIPLKDSGKLLKIHDSATEIFILLHDITSTDILKRKISHNLPSGLTVQTYREQIGDFYYTLQVMKAVYAFIEGLILFLASFVIVNTMMMAVFERMHEIGTLKSLGFTDRELFMNFTLEGAILGITGGIPGAAAGFLIIVLLSHTGVDLTSQLKDVEMPVENIIKPVIGMDDFFTALLMSVIIPSAASMLPAGYAKKLMPAEALKK